MKDSLKRAFNRLMPSKVVPAPVKAALPSPAPAIPAAEADDDTTAYSGPMAETLINGLVDRLDSTREQVRSLAQVNHALTSQLAKANATITTLSKQPRNKYWGARQGKGK